MKILGIDPGIGRAGWGVIEMASGKWQVANYGCIETSKDVPTEKRLESLHNELATIIKREKPDAASVEELFFSTNAKTAMVVGEARGVILFTLTSYGLPVATYTPLQVKIAVTGYGHAEKKQVETMMMLQLGMKVRPKIDDASDALAVAFTHALSRKMEKVSAESS
ncbi:MAG: crossover junction endodeoxyribonuclease RuvC [bacterium]|nr:crossover junction endodeoxyribonuclease RuvC [bacterium]